jgi:hypothetical protein
MHAGFDTPSTLTKAGITAAFIGLDKVSLLLLALDNLNRLK